MDCNLKVEDVLCRAKDHLTKQKIKLWLEPFYNEINGVGPEEEHALQALCWQLTQELNITEEICMVALRELQDHALSRLKANQVFLQTGVACLRVRVSGEQPRTLTVNISLCSLVSEVMGEVGRAVNTPSDRVKLICQGKVLKPNETLEAQGVKNGSQLMAVIIGDGKLQEAEKRFKTLEKTKKDVELLAGRSNHENEFYLQLENQAGEAISLPHHERKALVTAMTLHEKGRAALKREDYPLALVLFLEADKEYSACNAQILSTVDNYALLHLDVAWCYLCLRSPAHIPDAERRLGLCEQSFHRSYGENLERLLALKGSTGNEAALFMRLHLLQGVVCCHQGRRGEARRLLELAQSELSRLKVDDTKLCLLMELGFTNAEARLGLRATHNNIEAAEELLQRKRTEKQQAREKNRHLRQQERERVALGLCEDQKQYCEPKLVEQMVNMGFSRRQSISALKMANNRISEALTLIQDTPHLLPSCSATVSEESVAQVVSLGVPVEVARDALHRCPELQSLVNSLTDLTRSSNAATAECLASISTSVRNLVSELQRKDEEKHREEMQAFKRVSQDLLDSDLAEDHLDISLAQEEQFLTEYLSLFD